MPTDIRPITRRKLSDQVLDRIKQMILSGDYAPGQALPSERDLMAMFGVGRPSVREALQTLSTLGLVRLSHGERARVLELSARTVARSVDGLAGMLLTSSPATLDQLKQARLFFERGMVREAAARAGREDIATLRMILDLQRRALGKPDMFIQADMALHIRIAALSGNPIFEALSEAMLGWLRQYHTEMLVWEGKETYTLAEHAAIIDCLELGDAPGAEAAMTHHLERAAALYTHSVR